MEIKTILRVTKNKGKSSSQTVYEFEQRISQEDQQVFGANGCIAYHQQIKMTKRRKR